MHQALEGIRILEWGTFHAGPGGSAILGDLGAEVIKIEQRQVGDPMRSQERYGRVSFALPGGRNMFFESANRNKKSITLNLWREEGREIAHRLAAQSDVFLTNFRQKVVEEAGMTYEILSQFNPRLIYTSVSAYGSRGPDRHQGGFDQQGQARSGLMFSAGEPDMPPLNVGFGVVDQGNAIMVSHAIITALLMRERCGIGQQVHVSLLGSALYWQYIGVLHVLWTKQELPRFQRSDTNPLRNHYRCEDGRWLSIGWPNHWENRWSSFCQALGQPELQSNPKFDTLERRLDNRQELISILDRIFATKPRDKWLEILDQYDIIACAVNMSLDLDSDPQIVENDYIVDFDDPVLGKVKIPGFPIQFSQADAKTRSLAPSLGEHTTEILSNLGGYSEQEISHLKEEGII